MTRGESLRLVAAEAVAGVAMRLTSHPHLLEVLRLGLAAEGHSPDMVDLLPIVDSLDAACQAWGCTIGTVEPDEDAPDGPESLRR